jgi:hypothetical protein
MISRARTGDHPMEIEGRSHLLVRMEEEEGGAEVRRRPIGFRPASQEEEEEEDQRPPVDTTVLHGLIIERQKIHDNEKTTARQKEKFLAENRKAFAIASGGRVTRTDEVVMWVLIFAGALIITLALLTAFASLSTEITLSFIGTVVGGTIATITQKIGKL